MTITKGYHPSHPNHELELKNYKKPYKCDGCKEEGFGPRYRCECEECDYDLHEYCMFNTPTMSHDFFPGSTFTFFDKPPKNCIRKNCDKCKIFCDACGKMINGFVYHCEENGWDLHPCCGNLKRKMNIGEVKFQLQEKVMSKCIWCKRKTLKGSSSKIGGWSYMSKCNKYHFHVYCVTEMLVEGWKTADYNDNKALALENMELPLQRRINGRRGGKYWNIVKIFLTTIAAILLGDPNIALTSFVFDFITNL